MNHIEIKKGRIWEKYRFRCSYCGYETYKWVWLLKLQLIFSSRIYLTCPKCHKTNCYVQLFHLRHDSTDKKEKQQNKNKLWDDRLWM